MPDAAARPRLSESIDSILTDWIGFAYPPVHKAIADANWQPDSPDAYCRRCGDSIGTGEATATGCATCRDGGELAGGIGDGVLRLGPYISDLQSWIAAIKYGRWIEMAEHLGALLGRAALDANIIDPQRTLIVPMPMPWTRRFYRGVDHSRAIAEGVAGVLNSPVVSILKKSHEPPQVVLPRSERKRRGARGLRVRRRVGGWPVREAHLLLIDDVRTTGATLRAAARLLKSIKPQKVICGVLAVSDSTARRLRAEHRSANQHAQHS